MRSVTYTNIGFIPHSFFLTCIPCDPRSVSTFSLNFNVRISCEKFPLCSLETKAASSNPAYCFPYFHKLWRLVLKKSCGGKWGRVGTGGDG